MKKLFWLVVVLLIVWLGVSASKNNSLKEGQGAANDAPIKIGFIADLSKEIPTIGVSARNAVELARDEINAKGGINGRKIEVISEDGKCSSQAASSAQKLMNVDKVFMIIGGSCSGETSSFVKTAMEQKVPVFSYVSSAPALSESGPYFFRNYPSDAYQGVFAAEYLFNTQKAKKVAVVYTINDWGTGIKEVFEKRYKELGGEIVLSEGTQQSSKEFRTQVAKIKSANPDYIYAPVFPESATVFFNQMNEIGLKTKVFGGDIWSDPKFAATVKPGLDLMYTEIKTGTNADFEKKVLARTKMDQVYVGSAQAYDAMNLVADVLKKTGTNADDFVKTLRASDYAGVSGQIKFDQNGDLVGSSYIIKRIENGKAVEVK